MLITAGLYAEAPSCNMADESAEDAGGKPGRLIPVNNGIQNGITLGPTTEQRFRPGFFTSYDTTETEDRRYPNGLSQSVPMRLTITDKVDISKAKIKFTYTGSCPGTDVDIDSTGVPPPPQDFSGVHVPYQYKPNSGAGAMRIWLADSSRSSKSVADETEPGDYVPPDVDLTPAQLGLSASTRSVVLYLEGVTASSSMGETIKATVDDEDSVEDDSVKVTVYGINLNADRNPLMTGAVADAVNAAGVNPHQATITATLTPSGLESYVKVDDVMFERLQWSSENNPGDGAGFGDIEKHPATLVVSEGGDPGNPGRFANPRVPGGGDAIAVADWSKVKSTLTSSNKIEGYWIRVVLSSGYGFDTENWMYINQVGGSESLPGTVVPVISVAPLALLLAGTPSAESVITLSLFQDGTTTAVPGHRITFKMAVVDELGQAVPEGDPLWLEFGSVSATAVTGADGAAHGVFTSGSLAGSIRIYAEDENVYVPDGQ